MSVMDTVTGFFGAGRTPMAARLVRPSYRCRTTYDVGVTLAPARAALVSSANRAANADNGRSRAITIDTVIAIA